MISNPSTEGVFYAEVESGHRMVPNPINKNQEYRLFEFYSYKKSKISKLSKLLSNIFGRPLGDPKLYAKNSGSPAPQDPEISQIAILRKIQNFRKLKKIVFFDSVGDFWGFDGKIGILDIKTYRLVLIS